MDIGLQGDAAAERRAMRHPAWGWRSACIHAASGTARDRIARRARPAQTHDAFHPMDILPARSYAVALLVHARLTSRAVVPRGHASTGSPVSRVLVAATGLSIDL